MITPTGRNSSTWDFCPLDFCPLGFLPLGISAPWDFCPLGLCPSGFLSLGLLSLGFLPLETLGALEGAL
jgi:hypothetical protein